MNFAYDKKRYKTNNFVLNILIFYKSLSMQDRIEIIVMVYLSALIWECNLEISTHVQREVGIFYLLEAFV